VETNGGAEETGNMLDELLEEGTVINDELLDEEASETDEGVIN